MPNLEILKDEKARMACHPIGLPHELLFWGEDVVGHVKEHRTILMLFFCRATYYQFTLLNVKISYVLSFVKGHVVPREADVSA